MMMSYPAQAMSHRAGAADSEAESATYSLLALLNGVNAPSVAAGHGGPALENLGGAKTLRQRIAGIITEDPDLNRWFTDHV